MRMGGASAGGVRVFPRLGRCVAFGSVKFAGFRKRGRGGWVGVAEEFPVRVQVIEKVALAAGGQSRSGWPGYGF